MTQITLGTPVPNQERPVVKDDTRSVRKAQALKANLAKRKQQQRARSSIKPE